MTVSALSTLISTNWLKHAITSQTAHKVRILAASTIDFKPDVGFHQTRIKQHIPGSMYFDLSQCTTPTKLIPFPLPNPKCLSEYIGNLGIDKETHIITYDQGDNGSALRVWWLFKHFFGHENVSLLDGGFQKWLANGFDVTTKPTTTTQKCQYECVPNPSLSRDYNDLQKNLESNKEQVVDVRPEDFFNKGYIPNSKSIPYSELFNEDGTFKAKEELKEVFQSADVEPTQPMVGTCEIGINACAVAAAAEIIGNRNVSIYTGSWNEWSERASSTDNMAKD